MRSYSLCTENAYFKGGLNFKALTKDIQRNTTAYENWIYRFYHRPKIRNIPSTANIKGVWSLADHQN